MSSLWVPWDDIALHPIHEAQARHSSPHPRITQPLGQTVRYEWDGRDRLSKKILVRTVSRGSSEHPEIRYTYESWGPLASARHFAKSSDPTPLKTITNLRDRAGALISLTDDAIQATPLYSYTVDTLGRTTQTVAKYIPGGNRTLDYGFDTRVDLLSLTLIDRHSGDCAHLPFVPVFSRCSPPG